MIRQEYKRCTFDGSQNPTKRHFLAKVRIVHDVDDDVELPWMMITSKDKSFSVKLLKENNAVIFDELYKNIVSRGWMGRKGHFHVLTDKTGANGKFKINSSRIVKNVNW